MLNTTNGEGVLQATITPEGIRSASIVIAIVPILCVYPFLQKHFVKGVLMGSVKG
jgi:putative aldouronate transport system permease protein